MRILDLCLKASNVVLASYAQKKCYSLLLNCVALQNHTYQIANFPEFKTLSHEYSIYMAENIFHLMYDYYHRNTPAPLIRQEFEFARVTNVFTLHYIKLAIQRVKLLQCSFLDCLLRFYRSFWAVCLCLCLYLLYNGLVFVSPPIARELNNILTHYWSDVSEFGGAAYTY